MRFAKDKSGLLVPISESRKSAAEKARETRLKNSVSKGQMRLPLAEPGKKPYGPRAQNPEREMLRKLAARADERKAIKERERQQKAKEFFDKQDARKEKRKSRGR